MLNLKRPAIEILIDLIYHQSQYRLDKDHVKFGLPQSLDQRPSDLTDENTFIPAVIDSAYDDRFDDTNGFLYRRLAFTEAGISTVHVDIVPPFTTYQLIDRLNAEYGLCLTESDLVDALYTAAPGQISLVANPYSYVWLGAQSLTVENNFIPIYRLNGFSPWTPADPVTLYQGESDQRLTALINQTNGLSLALGSDLSFGHPSPTGDPAYNTQVIVTPLGDRTGGPTETVFYNRLNLSVLNDLPPGTITQPDTAIPPFTIHQLLPSINQALGLSLRPEEVVDQTYPHYTGAYDLVIDESVSLAWTGSYRFALDKDLASDDFQHVLDGFTVQELIANPSLSVYDLLTESNRSVGIVFNTSNAVLGFPVAGQLYGKNTAIPVTAIKGAGLADTALFYYDRVDISAFNGHVILESDNLYRLDDIISEVNAATNLSLTLDDFEPVNLPSMQYADQQTLALVTKADNLRYQGTLFVELNVEVPIPVVDDLHQLLHGVLPLSGPYF